MQPKIWGKMNKGNKWNKNDKVSRKDMSNEVLVYCLCSCAMVQLNIFMTHSLLTEEKTSVGKCLGIWKLMLDGNLTNYLILFFWCCFSPQTLWYFNEPYKTHKRLQLSVQPLELLTYTKPTPSVKSSGNSSQYNLFGRRKEEKKRLLYIEGTRPCDS